MTSTASRPARGRSRATLVITAAVLAAVVILFFVFAGLYTDVLWYDQVGYLNVLTTQWFAFAAMFAIGFAAMALVVWLSIFIAYRARPVYARLDSQLDRYQQVVEPLRRVAMIGIPLVLGLFTGVSTASRWPTVLQYLNRTPFGEADPQFGLDIGFFVFELPFYRGVVAYASAVVLIAGLAALATCYLYGGIRITGREVRVAKAARIQLAITAGVYLLLQGVSIWLDQYATVIEPKGLITGATFTDVSATIPGRAILAGIAVLVAVLAFVTAVIGRWRLPVVGVALFVVSSLVIGSVYPAIVQRFQVDPNARSLEAPYIERAIEATRAAYGIDGLQVMSYDAVTDAERGALREDAETTANIRILDPALVNDTFSQLERVRQYYRFANHLDVDRYVIDGRVQDTVIAVRELNQQGQSQGGWYNDTLVYTHGYGVVAAYGNQRSPDGQPVFLHSGIPNRGALGEFEPRVYFGEHSPEYSIVGGRDAEAGQGIEIDFPASRDGERNAYTTFTGDGGPVLDNLFIRLLYAIKFQSEEIFLSDDISDGAQILYDRHPAQRVQKVAPYLTLDSDIYPAVVDGRIVWIVDGYTTTANYPYSEVVQLSAAIADTYTPSPAFPLDDINYIRNSVKATVDAYDGTITLYAWDPDDPVLQTWTKIFPATVQPQSEMSETLLAHVRYPVDLFKVQRAIIETYHVTDPGEFFSGNEAWDTPLDPAPPRGGVSNSPQPPYYLTMQVPGTDTPAFTLYSTYIPRTGAGAAQNILTGYLAVNSDYGEDYGQLRLLTLPKDNTVPGPGQVQNQFDSDAEVAETLNILGRGDTTVIRGNLLTLPVGGGLLYVQPVYVQSNASASYPLLRKVLVAFGEQVAFEDTLDQALDSLFGGDSGASAGDEDVPGGPGEEPTEPTEPGGEPSGGAELQAAIADYLRALADREAAYQRNDLVAAARADQRMQEAVERMIAALEQE